MKVGETKKQRKHNMKEDEWRGTKKEDGETKKTNMQTEKQRRQN